ncbi:MAG TPA: hypothetical protein VHN74_19875 [Candidatus Angelobacter sp.]|nr:hypothetical protein [Candidatus Angelobacter sp.]
MRTWHVKVLLVAVLLLSTAGSAQSNDLAVTFGAAISPASEGIPTCEAILICPPSGTLSIDSGFTVGGSFTHRLANFHVASLGLELPLFAAPSRSAPAVQFRQDFSSLFFTPSLQVRFLPGAGISPFVSGGAGVGYFSGTSGKATWATQIGGGLDFKTGLPHLGFRVEARDFISGVPKIDALSLFTSGHLQHVVAGGGIVFKF